MIRGMNMMVCVTCHWFEGTKTNSTKDSCVVECGTNEIVVDNAYMLFYSRRQAARAMPQPATHDYVVEPMAL